MSEVDAFIQHTSCDTCPFNESGPGRTLRDTLAEGRFERIVAGLHKGEVFYCHKTVHYEDEYERKGGEVCAGALAYQRKNHCVPDAVQIGERLAAIHEARKARW